MQKVTKVDGREETFDEKKIFQSIWKSAQDVGGTDEKLAWSLERKVIKILKGKVVSTGKIGDIVEKVLIENGHAKTAKAYILFRENKKHLRQDKASLGIIDDIGLSYNTLYILKSRYLKRNEKGETVETPKGMVERVAKFLSAVEKNQELQEKWNREFYNIMSTFEFTPGTRTLTNSGKREAQLANCFVFDIEDDIDGIFQTLHQSTLIKKHGGGCGYNFSKIRPEGDSVGGVPGLAAGPIRIMEMFDLMTSLFRQEGKYESGNMAILNVNHPDIFNCISAKQNDGYLAKTNISIGINDDFMKAVTTDKNWDLVNPRTGEVVNTVSATSIFELMASQAWATGDPGLINLSAINKGTALANPLLKAKGPIMATNVCGEIPCYPYESCNLGYLNFPKFVQNAVPAGRQGVFNFKRFEEVIKVAVRLLDNVIDASWFPVREVEKAVRSHRRLGLGGVGWAETLIMLGIAYDSSEAFNLAEKIAKTMYQTAFDASCDLAKEKGPFPQVNDSIWAGKTKKPRNVALLTYPPSSGNAVICETSYGIEPLFALAYEQNVLEGMKFKNINKLFSTMLTEKKLYSDNLIQKIIDNHGSCQGIAEVPKSLQKIFKVAHDIGWRDHLKMQAAFQKWTDNAITKTINMSKDATTEDVKEAYLMAWKMGCKGLTIYRDQSKLNQVIQFGGGAPTGVKKKEYKCPTCNLKLVRDGHGKCLKCKKCGFSTCEL